MPQTGDYLLDEYASVTAGEPYRLFPFGVIVKNGKRRKITPELAAQFRLPHFKPPIKRGSHAEDAPAGGFINALEVRPDGLWAIPEYNDKGRQAVIDGDFRYHSPEVIWSDGPVFEDPQTGEMIHGPLIVGDALLHTPHLGEQAALYSVKPYNGGNDMTEQTRWEKFQAWFEDTFEKPEPKPEPEPKPAVKVEDYNAAVQKAEEYKAQLDQMQAEADKKSRIEKYAAAIAETKANAELVEIVAGLDDEVAERIVQEFKALSAQINEAAILEEKGTTGDGLPDDPAEAFNAAVLAKAQELKLDYNAAMKIVVKESPELARNYGG